MSETKQKLKKEAATEFGRAGGLVISKNRDHMKAIGKKGGRARWKGHKKIKK